MHSKLFIFFAAAIVSSFPALSAAYVVGGSNLPLNQYPEFDAFPPSAPYSHEEWEFQRYRDEVESYVREAQEYVENAANDQKRAAEAADDAIQKANQAIEEFNSWARGY